MLEWLFYFFVYDFLGWCVEVIYAATKSGRFINRGFLNGPACPIYGVGVIFVLRILEPVKNNLILMFFGAVIITSLTELIAGFLLEKLFYQRWWDYSDEPFQIGGYICLKFSLIWGVACLIVIDRIHPIAKGLYLIVPDLLMIIFLSILFIIFIVDSISTMLSICKLNQDLSRLDRVARRIHNTSDKIGTVLMEGTLTVMEKKEDVDDYLENKKQQIVEHLPRGQKRLLKAFPKMKSTKHNEILEKIKKKLFSEK